MIGHYLATLTEAQEDRVLTVPFGPLYSPDYLGGGYDGCLMCAVTATNWGAGCVLEVGALGLAMNPDREPGYVYEHLCKRFGAPRVNAAIRSRILSNRARRVLSGVPTPQEQPQ